MKARNNELSLHVLIDFTELIYGSTHPRTKDLKQSPGPLLQRDVLVANMEQRSKAGGVNAPFARRFWNAFVELLHISSSAIIRPPDAEELG